MSTEGEPKIPEPRDDDPEEVADKLSIAAAMWARGERADALSWLRRAAESASDVEADTRALELAKVASALASLTSAAPAPAAAAAPAGPAPSSSMPSAAAAGTPPRPSTPPQRPPASRPAPRPSGKPPSMGKLAPLPPLRPLGTAPAAPARPVTRRPDPPPRKEPSSSSMQAVSPQDAAPSFDREPIDHDQTSQMPAAAALLLARSEVLEAAADAPPSSDESELLETMRREAIDHERREALSSGPASFPKPSDAAVTTPFGGGEPPSSAQRNAPPASTSEIHDRLTTESLPLPIAVGMRVRVFASEGNVWVVPDHGSVEGGTPAMLVPLHPDDDLRSVFGGTRRS